MLGGCKPFPPCIGWPCVVCAFCSPCPCSRCVWSLGRWPVKISSLASVNIHILDRGSFNAIFLAQDCIADDVARCQALCKIAQFEIEQFYMKIVHKSRCLRSVKSCRSKSPSAPSLIACKSSSIIVQHWKKRYTYHLDGIRSGRGVWICRSRTWSISLECQNANCGIKRARINLAPNHMTLLELPQSAPSCQFRMKQRLSKRDCMLRIFFPV